MWPAGGDSRWSPRLMRPCHSDSTTAVIPFVVAFVHRHHPLSTPADMDCLAHDTAQPHSALPRSAQPAIYLGHTPPLRLLNHLTDSSGTGDQPGGRSGSCVSHSLCTLSLVASGCYPAGRWLYVRPPGRHSFEHPIRAHISPGKT